MAEVQARRRQERGRARIDQILAAAAASFGELGYEGTTTNAIAARAGMSPGSLYQFFANKDDIARAMAERYADELAHLDDVALVPAGDDLGAAVRAALEPIVAFNLQHPGFKALFARTDMPAAMRDAVAPVHQRMEARVAALVSALIPGLDADGVSTTTTVVLHMVRGLMPAITAAAGDQSRATLARELERSLTAYLEAVAAEVPARRRPR
jgi:AcrR family transcriptional regulator